MKTQKYSGQIMVIVLLLLSILSIVALTATLTTVRDTEKQVQNEQYQQYYSLGENNLLDLQGNLGTAKLASGSTNITLDGNTGTCTSTGTVMECNFKTIKGSTASSSTSETFDIYDKIVDSNYIIDYKMQKDQDILLDISGSTSDEATYIFWNGSTTGWGVSYDYKSGSEYYTDKVNYGGPFTQNGSSQTPSSTCLKIDSVTSADTNTYCTAIGATACGSGIKVTRQNIPSCGTALDYRIRAYDNMAGTNKIQFSLNKVGNGSPLQRTITSVTSTSDQNAASQSGDNPTAVLQTSYLLVSQPLSLFDYVLRVENSITK